VRYSTHDFYKGQEVKAAEFYTGLAHQAVISLAYQGIPKIEVVQALCMLVLVDVAGVYRTCLTLLIEGLQEIHSL
jgi:hypothetical protein